MDTHNNEIVLIEFHADWCGPCQMMKPVFKSVSKSFKDRLKLKKIDIDKHQDTAGKYNVFSIPTLVLEKGGKEIARKSGYMNESDLTQWIEKSIK